MSNNDLWERRLDYAERHPIAYLGWWAVGITIVGLVIAAVIGLASTGSVFFQSASSNATLKARENIQRNSTGNAVTSIAFFHNTCNDVVAQLAVYNANAGRAKHLDQRALTETDPIRRQQAQNEADAAQEDASGALNAAINSANDYNAKATNSLNGKFREEGLPDSIVVDTDHTTPPTCG